MYCVIFTKPLVVHSPISLKGKVGAIVNHAWLLFKLYPIAVFSARNALDQTVPVDLCGQSPHSPSAAHGPPRCCIFFILRLW